MRVAKSDDDASSRATARAELENKKGAIRRGKSGSPSGLLVSRFEVGARGDYAAKTDLPRSLAMAWRSICRTRSAVIPQIAPISASFA